LARGKPREDAILTAALAELQRRGYAAMTMDGVAARAHASKATIYRRWKSKAELIKAALDAADEEHSAAVPDTGALRSDLVAAMRALQTRASSAHVDTMRELAAAARHDAELASLLRVHVQAEELSPLHQLLGRAVRRREVSRSVDESLVHDVVEALILLQLQLGLPLDDAFAVRVVDRVVLPLLKQGRK